MTCLILVLGIFMLFVLCSCQPLDQEYILSKMLPNLWVFLAHLISAAVLITVLIWLVWKPTKGMLQKRHDFIANEIAEATKSKEAANMEYTKANQLKVDALSQAMGITTTAKAEAFTIIERAKEEAYKTSNAIKANAYKDIEAEKEALAAKAHDNVVNIAFDVANTILQKEVTVQDKDKYIDDLLSSISQDLDKNK